jgi:hypothetical protein
MEELTHLQSLRLLLARHGDPAMIVACPLARGSMGYRGIAENDVYDVMADVKRRYPVDEDRVYLMGASMGGAGTLWLGLTRPGMWAGIVPMCAEPVPEAEELTGNALNLPVLLFHGEQDPLVPVKLSRAWQKRFLQQGVHAEYVEYPLLRHNVWEKAYRDGGIFDWFAKFKHERFPDRVRFASRAYKYDSAYWVHLDRLIPGTAATIDAQFAASNRLQVTTHELDGFTLKLAGHPKYSTRTPLQINIDGTMIRPRGRDTFSFMRTAKGWAPGSAPIPAGQKRPGLEGPIAEAIAARHIYVHGGSNAALAREAAEWSTARAHLTVAFAVKADKQVTPEDTADANLILFGNKETNELIARFAKQLPMELSPSAADYGLVFIAPVGNRYVVVNSGLPWWTGADRVADPGWRANPAPFRVLDRFGDYVLFKGSLDRVVAEGRFDRNWRLPPAAAQKLIETGAVVISSCCQKSSADSATK